MNKLKHFHSIQDVNTFTIITGLLSKAIFFAKNVENSKIYINKTFASIFMEPSTRTEMSFKIACQKLGINVVDLNMDSSSITKGETFEDTLQTLEAMGIEGAIIRTKDETLIEAHRYSRKLSLINAGSGQTSHPSQAMLDLLTIHNSFDRINDLKVTIVGDIKHSRVAASHIELHKALGNEISICSPREFHPIHRAGLKENNLIKALEESDVIIFLRVQFERHETHFFSKEEYCKQYSLNQKSIKHLNKKAIILHPGPVNRDIEISSELLSHPQVKILEQVKNSIPMRMAIINYLLGDSTNEDGN